MLDRLAQSDHRIKAVHQDNKGLTESLITGCEMARGTYIARQDIGDFSEPDRLQKQIQFLEEQQTFSVVSSWVSSLCAMRYALLQVSDTSEDVLFNALTSDDVQLLHGPPHHGAVMFRKSEYQQSGGYRKQFYFAQDLDLWTRMIQYRKAWHYSRVALYKVIVYPDGISWIYNAQQNALKSLIAEAITLRRIGNDDKILQRASDIRPNSSVRQNKDNVNKKLG